MRPVQKGPSSCRPCYASRLKGEPVQGGVDDIHFHPVEPRSVRVTLTVDF